MVNGVRCDLVSCKESRDLIACQKSRLTETTTVQVKRGTQPVAIEDCHQAPVMDGAVVITQSQSFAPPTGETVKNNLIHIVLPVVLPASRTPFQLDGFYITLE